MSKVNDGSTTWSPQSRGQDNEGGGLPDAFVQKWLLWVIKWRTPAYVLSKIVKIANLHPEDTFLDLGCGDGRVLVAVAEKSGATCVGYEINAQVAEAAEARAAASSASSVISVRRESAYLADFSKASCVYVYSNKRGLFQLVPLLQSTTHEFTLIIYLTDAPKGSFPGAHRTVHRCSDPDDALGRTPLYCYRMNAQP